MNNHTFKVSAPGKIILSGEHSVVYGYPALVASVNRRLEIKDGKISSNIPIGAGMGSSAAFAVATSAYKQIKSSKPWNLDQINKRAYLLEKEQHGSPSGVDNTVSTYGGFLWYRKETENLKTFQNINIKNKIPPLFVINTGKPTETTKEMVLMVAENYKKNPNKIKLIFKDIEDITKSFAKLITGEANFEIIELIKNNEALLERLSVVSKSTIELIKNIEKIGGAAKISGAGGYKTGSGIIIVYHKDPEKLQKFAKINKLDIFGVKLGGKGVIYE